MNNCLGLLICGVGMMVLGGCVTQKLWHSDEHHQDVTRTARSEMIYTTCPDGDCAVPKMLFAYHAQQAPSELPSPSAFPPLDIGYLIMSEGDCLSAINQGLLILTKETTLLGRDVSLHANIRVIQEDIPLAYDPIFTMRATKPLSPSVTALLDHHQDLFHYYVTQQAGLDDAGQAIPAGMVLIRLGPWQCRESPALDRVQLVFGKTLPLSTGSQNWSPLKGEETLFDTHLVFIKTGVTKTYRQSVAKRILLTPLALLADVVMVLLISI